MNHDEKSALARTGDVSKEAAGLRLYAARTAAGLSQTKLGQAGGVSKAAISNAEKGLSYPGHKTLVYLYEEHRIDLNFTVYGSFNQLPADVQDAVFDALSSASTEPAQVQGSN